MRFKKIVLPLLAAALLGSQAQAQSVSYTPLFDNSTFSRSIDLSKPVGTIDGAAGTTPSGAATYTIPIKMPPGTKGMTPQLSIVYNSQGGNGILGQGWSLSGLSAITRAGKDFYHDGKAGPVTYTNEDAFVLDGQRLSPISGSNGAPGTTYRTEAESYSVTTSYETIGGGPRYFNVVSKDGTIMQYGYTDDARFVNDDDSKIMMWRLNKIQDINGNYISFHYDNSDRDSRLVKIAYTGNQSAGLSPYNEINFQYATRSDRNKMYDAGNSFNSKYLLWQIQVKEKDGDIFKTWQFDYGKNNTGISYLKMIEEFAADNSKLNDTRFKYGEEAATVLNEVANTDADISNTQNDIYSGDFNGDGFSDLFIGSNTVAPSPINMPYTTGFKIKIFNPATGTYNTTESVSFSGTGYTQIGRMQYMRNTYALSPSDFNGDGLEDVIYAKTGSFSDGTYRYLDEIKVCTMNPSGYFDWCNTFTAPAGYGGINSKFNYFYTGDFDGDSKTDFITILSTSTGSGYNIFFTSVFGGPHNYKVTVPGSGGGTYQENGIFQNADRVAVINMDGDPKMELLVIEDGNARIYKFNVNSSGISMDLVRTIGYPTTWHDIYFGDFNGDGKTDILTGPNPPSTPSNTWSIGYSDGHTFLEKPFVFDHIVKQTTPAYTGASRTDIIALGDFNGDGKSDIYNYYNNSSAKTHKIYFGTGESFTEKSQATSRVFGKLAPGDYNGDGKVDLLNYHGALHAQFNFFQPHLKSHLLEKVTDGFNRTTEFIYDPLTKGGDIYTKGSGETYPVNNAQYPVYVVTSMKTPDGIGGISNTAFRYENLRVHRTGRGLLGFEKVKSYNNLTDLHNEATYELNRDFYVPYLKSSKTFLNSKPEKYSQSITNYDFTRDGSGYCFTQANPSGSSEDLLRGTGSSYSNTYDADGNITRSETTLNGDVTITTKTATTYTAVGGSPRPNAPSEITVTTTRSGQPSVMDKSILQYDGKGRLVHSYSNPNGIVSPETLHKYWQYDGYGNKIMEKEMSISVPGYAPATRYKYDRTGRFVTQKINALGDYTGYRTHKFWGKPLSVTALNGLESRYAYDAWGKLVSETIPLSPSSAYTRTYSDGWDLGSNQLYYTQVKDPSSPDLQTWYDELGRAVRTRREHFSGDRTDAWTRYDARGNVEQKSNEYLPAETPLLAEYTYDEWNRVQTETTVAGTTEYAYDFSGGAALVTVTLPDGKVKKTKTDASGKLLETDNGITGTVQFDYDSRGNELYARMKVFSGTGFAFVQKEYDNRGRLLKLKDADAGTTTYKYDAFDRLVEQKDPNSKTTKWTYDKGLGLLQQKILDGCTTTYKYYDRLKEYRLQTETVSSTAYGTVADDYDYNEAGSPTRHSKNTNGVLMEKVFGYDAFGRLSTTQYPSGLRTRQHYDGNGYLAKITTDFLGGGPGDRLLYRADELQGDGRLTTFTRSNGLQTVQEYKNGYLIRMTDASGMLDLMMDYDYSNGNLMARAEDHAIVHEQFTYDAADRLVRSKAVKWDPSSGLTNWPPIEVEYDKPSPSWTGSYGQIVSKSDAGTYKYPSFPRNGVATISDPEGLVSHETQDISYTPFHKTEQITETIGGIPYEERFVYDAAEDRAYSAQWQGGALARERWYMGDYERSRFDGFSEQQIHYISGDAGLCAIVVEEGGAFNYYTAYTDHLGSIVLLTDETGTPIYRQAYDPWGRERDPGTWGYGTGSGDKPRWLARGYTGHEMLPEYGLINMNGRMYDPLNGRMLRPDNYVQDPTNTQSYNRFSYCWNNPMKYTDPSGDLVWFVPFVYAGINLAFDLAMSGGKMNFGQIATSLVSGAIGGAIGGGAAKTFASALVGATFSQLGRMMPAVPLVQSENFSLSVSPMAGVGSSGFNIGGSVNASGRLGDFAFSASVGAGFNSGVSSLGEGAGGSGYISGGGFAGYFDGNANYGAGYSYTAFGGKTAQGVGAVTAQIGDFSLRFDEDFFGDGGDRYRTGGLLATYRINNDLTLAVGGSMMTGMHGGKSTAIFGDGLGPNGTYDNCRENLHNLRGGTLYGGVIYKGQSYLYGNNSEKRLHTIQNAIHRNWPIKTSPYFEDRMFGSRGYSYYGRYNSLYLNY